MICTIISRNNRHIFYPTLCIFPANSLKILFWLTDSWGNFFQWHSLTSWPGIQSDNKALVNCPEPFHENMRVHTGQVLYLVLNQASHSSRSEPMNCKRILKLLFLQWKNWLSLWGLTKTNVLNWPCMSSDRRQTSCEKSIALLPPVAMVKRLRLFLLSRMALDSARCFPSLQRQCMRSKAFQRLCLLKELISSSMTAD